MSSLPLADCQIEIQRGLTTSSTAIFVPFTTQELFDNGKEALYYGLNALSNNLIMVDRKKLKNPNGLILGTPGSGKSFSAKREICNAFLVTDDDILVCDPESEYTLPSRAHGRSALSVSRHWVLGTVRKKSRRCWLVGQSIIPIRNSHQRNRHFSCWWTFKRNLPRARAVDTSVGRRSTT